MLYHDVLINMLLLFCVAAPHVKQILADELSWVNML